MGRGTALFGFRKPRFLGIALKDRVKSGRESKERWRAYSSTSLTLSAAQYYA